MLLWNILILTPPSKCPAEIALKCFLWRWWGFAEDKHSLANRFEMTDLLRFPCLLVCHCYNLYLLSYLIWPHSAHFVRVCLWGFFFCNFSTTTWFAVFKTPVKKWWIFVSFPIFFLSLFFFFGGGRIFHRHEINIWNHFLRGACARLNTSLLSNQNLNSLLGLYGFHYFLQSSWNKCHSVLKWTGQKRL